MSQEEVIAEVSGSKLRGRSGGLLPDRPQVGLPAHVADDAEDDGLQRRRGRPRRLGQPHDDGERPALADRGHDDRRLRGRAPCDGYIYIREEYPLAFERMQRAVEQARERGVLGANVLGSDFAFDLKVVRGAGSYVCGEESGLIASIEDARGMPKIRPPFPAASGVFGAGQQRQQRRELPRRRLDACAYGVEKYAEVGTERNAGHDDVLRSRATCSASAASSCRSARRCARRTRSAAAARRRATPTRRCSRAGRCSASCRRSALDLGIEPESFREGKRWAWAAAASSSWTTAPASSTCCTQYEWFLEDESCGRCTTCHGGTQRMVEILRRIQRGGGRESDIGKLQAAGGDTCATATASTASSRPRSS